MGRRAKITVAVLLVTVAAVIAWRVLSNREPLYQGRPVRLWLEKTDPYFLASRTQIGEVVRHTGTNAIPILLQMMQAKDSPLVLKWASLTRNHPFLKNLYNPPVPAEERRVRAVYGFAKLGPDAKDAVPTLIALYGRDLSVSGQATIANALGRVGPPAKAAIPFLLSRAANSNIHVRANALYALGHIHAEPHLVVPVLVQSLSDPEMLVRLLAAEGLKLFGADAQAAVPPLVAMLQTWNVEVRRRARTALESAEQDEFSHEADIDDLIVAIEDALKVIDPAAAAKEGIR